MNLFQNQPVSIRLTVEDVHDGVGRPGGDGDGGVVEAAHVAVAAGVDKVAAGGAGVLVAEEAALLRGRRRPGGFRRNFQTFLIQTSSTAFSLYAVNVAPPRGGVARVLVENRVQVILHVICRDETLKNRKIKLQQRVLARLSRYSVPIMKKLALVSPSVPPLW